MKSLAARRAGVEVEQLAPRGVALYAQQVRVTAHEHVGQPVLSKKLPRIGLVAPRHPANVRHADGNFFAAENLNERKNPSDFGPVDVAVHAKKRFAEGFKRIHDGHVAPIATVPEVIGPVEVGHQAGVEGAVGIGKEEDAGQGGAVRGVWFRCYSKLHTTNDKLKNIPSPHPFSIQLTSVDVLITPFETELYEKMGEFFARHGFAPMPEKKQFRKVTETGFQNVIFSATTYEKEIWLEVNFGLRHERVEQVAQQFLGNLEEFQADANTLVVSIGKFNDAQYFRYKIGHEDRARQSDLDETCLEIQEFLVERGFDFLNRNDSLAALHVIYNAEPTKPCKFLYNQVHRGFKGLITARLLYSDDFLGLADLYRNQLVRLGASFHELHQYERLLSFLLYHSVN